MSQLTRLSIRDFRNMARAELHLPPDGVVVVGDNGQGKTNLLEAVSYLHVLRSIRGVPDAALIRFDQPAFHIAADVITDHGHALSAAFERNTKRKKIRIDGADVTRLSQALGALPSVMVSPRDVDLITGAPTERRRFLDITLALTSPAYLAALQSYRAALARRNAALRDIARAAPSARAAELAIIWEPQLAEHGAVLLAERARWVGAHVARFAALCDEIGESMPAAMRYRSSVPLSASVRSTDDRSAARAEAAEALRGALAEKRALDMKRGATHVGPHRDELALTLGGHDLKQYGSAGQQRTIALALRLLEAEALQGHAGHAPVLLLDDPFAELDARRADRILALLHARGVGQTILTVPRAADIPAEFTRLPRWRIAGGEVTA